MSAAPLRKVVTLDRSLIRLDEPCPPFVWKLSPNHGKRAASKIDTLVLHCTAGGSTAGAMSRLLDASAKASSHIVIPKKGQPGEPAQTQRLVADEQAAWHCRAVPFQGVTGVNSRSLGIEIVNTAEPADLYTDWQIDECVRWCRYWCGKHPIQYIVTHGYLDPSRRSDPCMTFPWDAFISRVESGAAHPPARETPIKIMVNGLLLDVDALRQEDSVWCELRPLAEAVGFKVGWDEATQTATVTK